MSKCYNDTLNNHISIIYFCLNCLPARPLLWEMLCNFSGYVIGTRWKITHKLLWLKIQWFEIGRLFLKVFFFPSVWERKAELYSPVPPSSFFKIKDQIASSLFLKTSLKKFWCKCIKTVNIMALMAPSSTPSLQWKPKDLKLLKMKYIQMLKKWILKTSIIEYI